MKTDLTTLLNPEQAKAASKIEGPLLIIAGAGSGKTRMITYRILHMLEEGIDERNILALTFTNKAAKEMSDRIRQQVGKPLKELTATTFHSFGLGILKQYIHHLGYHNDFTLYDTNDNEALIKNCIISCGYQIPDYNVRSLITLFSNLKMKRTELPSDESAINEIYKEWLLTQKAYNVVDFDDLIILPIKLFEEKPWILEAVQDRYRYIMVDEFQDTSLMQYKFVSMIAKKYRNIAVVGDDDQSIYSWRGANYENIMMFERDFPEREEFKLERNYRSTGNILKAANALIAHNTERKEKKLWTEEGTGAAISIMRHEDAFEESSWIAGHIKEDMKKPGMKYGDIGVLVRTNALITELENTFTEMSIPVRISGGKSFFDRREIRDMLCYLKVLLNKSDDTSLLRIINTPRRGIGRTTVERLRRKADDEVISLYDAISRMTGENSVLQEKTKENLKTFVRKINEWTTIAEKHPEDVLKHIVEDTGYAGMLAEEFPDNPKQVDYKMKGIEILSSRIARFIKENQKASLLTYVNAAAIAGDESEDDENKVNLMTMHASKGLEFRIVYLAGISAAVIPSPRSIRECEDNIDEERRLFYVAITRAREKLVINYPENITTQDGTETHVLPSPFIDEIPQELLKSEEMSEEEKRRSQAEMLKAFLAERKL